MKLKNKIIILVSACLVILAGVFLVDYIISKSYLNKISYNDVIEKIEDKESFILLISQTTCTHCMSYKPKLEEIANKHKIEIYYIDVDLLSDEDFDKLDSYLNFADAGTPVTLFVKNGEETSAATRITGDASSEKIEKKLKSNGFLK